MTTERLEEIEQALKEDVCLRDQLCRFIYELIADNKRLRITLNEISGKANKAVNE